jgi:NAD+ synthase (glutamine-hydrolysing)
MSRPREFFNLYSHDLLRVAVGVPALRVADPAFNAEQTIELFARASAERAAIVLFPELGLSAYSCDDLFHQRALLDATMDGLAAILKASESMPAMAIVGLPLQIGPALYNCAAAVHRGKIRAVVPKTYLPNYREFYEARQFASGNTAIEDTITLLGQDAIPFGQRLLLQSESDPRLTCFVEICEDLWVPIPPSSTAALAGATVLLNLSASNITVAKAGYRRELVASQSARCLAAYLYSAAGPGESTTDLAWDGHALIAENGDILAESERFTPDPDLIMAEVDLERLAQDRMRQGTFGQTVLAHRPELDRFRTVSVPLELPADRELYPQRVYPRFPYVPADPATRDARCAEVFNIQVQGLAKRLEFTKLQHVVIGVSGGLDSAQALLVCAKVMDRLGYPRSNILAYTMPGFATSTRTREQAHALMQAIGAHANEIDIRPSCMQMLKDLGHPFAKGEPVYDVTFENVQAGERTSHLFRLANFHNGLVVGTGDLSELALGWCTYGVGDHMSHYSVNASVPKTLIQHVIRWVAETAQLGAGTSAALRGILATEISPELVPGDEGSEPAQGSEAFLGPYELHDFFLYYTLRFGFAPPKVAFLAHAAWRDRDHGLWPDIPEDRRHEYELSEIKKHLGTFLDRFFRLSQFKRSTIPNAPKVGSGGSLSPRGDWRAPSDAESTAWLRQLDQIPDA